MGEPRTDPVPPAGGTWNTVDDDYQVIRLRVSWGAVSILAFAAILTLQLFGHWLRVSLPQVILGTAALALAGLVLGLIGMKFGSGRGAARIGAFLNGAVLGIFVLVPIVTGILRQLR